MSSDRSGFTLIELLIVIAIIAILAVVVVLVLNPAQLLAQSRDANRVSDLATLNSAASLYQTDESGASGYSLGTSSVIYASIPDSSSACGNLGLTPLSGNSWGCSTVAAYRSNTSVGWVPIAFSSISAGAPFGSLPVDPTNSSSTGLFYTYATNGIQYELTAGMESSKYNTGGSGDVITGDGAPLSTVYAKGTSLLLEPFDYNNDDASLVGYWPLNEGTGTAAVDDSGRKNNGTWSGTQAGASGYYGAGSAWPWGGYFNGSNDWVDVPVSASLNPTAALTITAWIHPSSVSSGEYELVRRESQFSLTMVSQVVKFWLNSGGSWANVASTGNVLTAPGQWYFIAVTWDGTSPKIYINGMLSTTGANYTAALTNNPSYDTFLGVLSNTSNAKSYFYSGSMSNVRIYNRALSAAEISSLYNGRK